MDAQDRFVPCENDGLLKVPALFVSEEGSWPCTETVAVEARVDVWVDGAYWASFAVSPNDLEDFAHGVMLSSGLVSSEADVRSVRVEAEGGVLTVRVERAGSRVGTAPQPCDVCRVTKPHAAAEAVFPCAAETSSANRAGGGKPEAADGGAGVEPAADSAGAHGLSALSSPKLSPKAVFAMSRSLLSKQGLHQATGATHAAVFADFEGRAVLMREDVGRHNAVDKLVGALMRAGVDAAEGFVYLSSRCALELVAKCARFGVRIVATVSAPTSAVLEFARAEGITLCAFARDGRFTVYTHPERLEL